MFFLCKVFWNCSCSWCACMSCSAVFSSGVARIGGWGSWARTSISWRIGGLLNKTSNLSETWRIGWCFLRIFVSVGWSLMLPPVALLATTAYNNSIFVSSALYSIYLLLMCPVLPLPDEQLDWIEMLQKVREVIRELSDLLLVYPNCSMYEQHFLCSLL